MKTYTDRLIYAMECRELDPTKDQTLLANQVGRPCKPQNIQYLLNPDNNARSSKYTPMIAEVLRCESLWLATGKGTPPKPKSHDTAATQNSPPNNISALKAEENNGTYWPWSVAPSRVRSLPPELIGRIDAYIEGRIEEYERNNPPQKAYATG